MPDGFGRILTADAMSIRLRLLLLLALMGLFSTLCFVWMERVQVSEKETLRTRRERELAQRLERIVAENSGSLWRYVRNYSTRPGAAEFVSKRDLRWAEKNLQDRLDTYRVDAAWIVQRDGTVLYGFNRASPDGAAEPPAKPEELRALLAQGASLEYFRELAGVLHQIYGQPIRGESGGAWLLAARAWNQSLVEEIARDAQGRVWLTGPEHRRDGVNGEELEAWRPLPGVMGQPIAGLDFHVLDPLAGETDEEEKELMLFLLNALGIVVIAGVLLWVWVWKPLKTLQHALKTGDTGALLPLLTRSDEFGHLSRSALGSIRDREHLATTLGQQSQLARDLHDGVIQNVFGAGMALATAEEVVTRDPAGARRLLAETRENLNQVIAELRRFIDRTDPPLATGGFAEAVRRIAQQLRGSADVRIVAEVDEALADQYAALVRGQLLQFAREALSNALRHGQPTQVTLAWRAEGNGSILSVEDDGRGFRPEQTGGAGRGLGNLSERAVALGGKLDLASAPGGGTRVSLLLPSPKRAP